MKIKLYVFSVNFSVKMRGKCERVPNNISNDWAGGKKHKKIKSQFVWRGKMWIKIEAWLVENLLEWKLEYLIKLIWIFMRLPAKKD